MHWRCRSELAVLLTVLLAVPGAAAPSAAAAGLAAVPAHELSGAGENDDGGGTARDLAVVSADPDIRAAFSDAPGDSKTQPAEALAAPLLRGEYGGRAAYEAAVVQLRRLGSAALPPIVAVIADRAQPLSTRLQAARLLGELGRPEAVPPLLEALRENNLKLSRAAAAALAELAPHDHAMELCRFLIEADPSDAETRWSVYDALGAAKNPEALPLLMLAQANEIHPDCRERAAAAVDAILGQRVGPNRQAQIRWIQQNRPEWMRYFDEQVKTHSAYARLMLYFVIGVILAGAAVWFMWTHV